MEQQHQKPYGKNTANEVCGERTNSIHPAWTHLIRRFFESTIIVLNGQEVSGEIF